MNCRLIILISIMLGVCTHAGSQTVRDSILIHFRQSKVDLDTAYMNNSSVLDSVGARISQLKDAGSGFILKDITVVGGASPEGSVKFNEWLSRQRATRIYDYINNRISLPDSLTSYTFLGRDWKGLREMVERDPEVPWRDDVIVMLDEIIEDYKNGEKESDGNLSKIKRLHNGIPYRYLYRKQFPYLRESRLVLTYFPLRLYPNVAPYEIDTFAAIDPILMPFNAPEEDKPFYMALKTNMLLDVLAVPEIGAEFYLGKNFSIVGNWEYGWWDNDKAHKYWRIYGGDIAIRKWFGKKAEEKPLTGHHLGVYGGVVTYDFEFGGKGYMGGLPGRTLWDRCNHYFGIEYGYSMPIARRLNIDFTAGVGYLGGKYIEYVPVDRCYVWQSTKYRHWYGPTKLEVSLVWLIGHGNYNSGKGGGR